MKVRYYEKGNSDYTSFIWKGCRVLRCLEAVKGILRMCGGGRFKIAAAVASAAAVGET